jgi:ABC-2 type transport system ATP-binding protein
MQPTPETEAPVLLEARGLSKRYEAGNLALDALDLQVRAGELFGLLGANGAGKTTTINLFLGFIEPTAGSARICGVEVARDPLAAKEQAAYVSENVMLYPAFTARQNLEFFARLAGKRPGRRELDRAMRRVGLEEEAFGRRVGTFSKGMRQKLGIAIAILKDAPVLLLDEPTSGLDPKASAELARLLGELRDEGKAILMSTHDLFRVRGLADTLGIMKEGRLVMRRPSVELAGEDLEALYLTYMAAGSADRHEAA